LLNVYLENLRKYNILEKKTRELRKNADNALAPHLAWLVYITYWPIAAGGVQIQLNMLILLRLETRAT